MRRRPSFNPNSHKCDEAGASSSSRSNFLPLLVGDNDAKLHRHSRASPAIHLVLLRRHVRPLRRALAGTIFFTSVVLLYCQTSLSSRCAPLLLSFLRQHRSVAMPRRLTFANISTLPLMHDPGVLLDPDRAHRPNYDGLDITQLPAGNNARQIAPDDATTAARLRRNALHDMDIDRHLSHRYYKDEDLIGVETPGGCRRLPWANRPHSVCNVFHEHVVVEPTSDISPYDINYSGHGYFRDSWLFKPLLRVLERFIYKRIRYRDSFPFTDKTMDMIAKEAIVMEQLTGSERVVNIHAYCGTSIVAQDTAGNIVDEIVPLSPSDGGYIRQEKLDRVYQHDGDVHPMNNLTDAQRLDWAITMAESLADIHGHVGGVIAHGDFHPEQFLRAHDGRLMLNDFNNGEILEWSDTLNDYCKTPRCYSGTFRSPEELACVDMNEQMDTYSMGQSIYTLLTGLWPFYQIPADEHYDIQPDIAKASVALKPFVDARYRNRTLIEGGLVRIMEQCWEFDMDRRLSSFDVVRQLRQLQQQTGGGGAAREG